MQEQAGGPPIPLDRALGDSAQPGDLGHGKPTEEMQVHQLGQGRVHFDQSFQRTAQALELLRIGRCSLGKLPIPPEGDVELAPTLLGLPADRLIERLRQARMLETQGVASAHGDAGGLALQPHAPPLESLLEDFWRGAGEIELVQAPAAHDSIKHALLRRLGPSPLQGRFPMVGLLASIYDAVSEAARRRGDGS